MTCYVVYLPDADLFLSEKRTAQDKGTRLKAHKKTLHEHTVHLKSVLVTNPILDNLINSCAMSVHRGFNPDQQMVSL